MMIPLNGLLRFLRVANRGRPTPPPTQVCVYCGEETGKVRNHRDPDLQECDECFDLRTGRG